MGKDWQTGTWLLLDAAGPKTALGLLREGNWLEYMTSGDSFLEGCQATVECLLGDCEYTMEQLSGILYAAGPGSTMGLRLAAMFARSLLQLPHLGHWQCAQYNNLELAAASLIDTGVTFPIQAVAPWRRDRVHRVIIRDGSPLEILSDALHPDELDEEGTNLFPLGNRPRNLPPAKKVHNFPFDEIPELLARYPQLLKYCREPSPFTAELPEFARWSSKRHSSR